MPELPEVETARALIEARALGRPIAAVDDADTYVCRPHVPGDIASALVGQTLTAANRIGKSMWLETGGGEGPSLGLHLGMAGRIVIVGEEGTSSQSTAYGGDPMSAAEAAAAAAGGHPDPRLSGNPAWTRFALEFEDGGALLLFDKRRLGRAVLNPDVSHLGPDALLISKREFRARVGAGDAPLKARIMDQSVLAGVGNLLADEALWQARAAPLRPAGSLDEDELDALFSALRKATKAAIRKGGVHTGQVIEHRRKDGACPRCGGPMVKAAVGGRTTWWCATEQSWPPA
jgi:formamidopyrimidine-DNA glycosylase